MSEPMYASDEMTVTEYVESVTGLHFPRRHEIPATTTLFGEVVEQIVINTTQECFDDGTLVPILPHRWKELSGGKPIIATGGFMKAHNTASAMEIWNDYVRWRKNVMPMLAREDQMFEGKMNGRKVWVMENGNAFTIMFSDEY